MSYSPAHLAAFKAWQDNDMRLQGLTGQQLADLSEDENFAHEIRNAQRKEDAARQAQAVEAQRKATQAPPSRELTTAEFKAITAAREGEKPEAGVRRILKALKQASWKDWSIGVDGFIAVIYKELESAVGFLEQVNAKNVMRNEKIQALEQRVSELESRPRGLVYQGVHSLDVQYVTGDVCTFKGAMWTAKVANKGALPGEGNAGIWQLCVKAGRDGRDATR